METVCLGDVSGSATCDGIAIGCLGEAINELADKGCHRLSFCHGVEVIAARAVEVTVVMTVHAILSMEKPLPCVDKRRYDGRTGSFYTATSLPKARLNVRWLLLVFTVFAVMLCFTRHSGGAMGFWLFVWIVGAFATALTFAKTRIADNARADSLSEYDLKRLREGRDPFDHDRSTPKR